MVSENTSWHDKKVRGSYLFGITLDAKDASVSGLTLGRPLLAVMSYHKTFQKEKSLLKFGRRQREVVLRWKEIKKLLSLKKKKKNLFLR